MTFSRPGSLRTLVLCFLAVRVTSLNAQQPAPANPPAPNPPQTTPSQPAQRANPFENVPQAPAPQAPRPANPFENVPQSPGPQAPKPEAPKTEAPKPAAPGAQPAAAPPENIIEDIIFRGARRVPQDVLRLQIMSKKGDPFDKDQFDHNLVALS